MWDARKMKPGKRQHKTESVDCDGNGIDPRVR